MPVTMLQRAVLALALAFAACASAGDDTRSTDAFASQDAAVPPAGKDQACASDADCPDGQTCSATAGACVSPLETPQVLSLAVDPLPGSGLVGDQFPFLTLQPPGTLDLSVPSPVTLSGRVVQAPSGGRWAGDGGALPSQADAGAMPVAGRLVAVAAGRIPGTSFRSEADVADVDPVSPDAPRFALSLLPNLSYRVTFIPGPGAFQDLPPHVFDLTAAADGSFDVVLPPDDAYVRLQGLVRAGDGPATPVRGAWVSCSVGGDRVGTTGTTDGEGLFQVVLPPGTGAVEVVVASGRDGTTIPTRSFRWDGGLGSLQNEYAAAGQFLTLDVGAVPPVRQVSVQVIGGQGFDSPVPLARVVAQGTAGLGEATVTAITGSDGVATLALLEGRYVLTVVPPADAPWAASETSLDLLKELSKAFLVRVGARPVVQGTVVRASDGTAVAGAQVAFLTDRATSDLSRGAELGSSREAAFDAVTDAQGAFRVALDAGDYAVTVQPPTGSGLPRVAWPSLGVAADATWSLPVPEGALLRGTVRSGADGQPLSGATLRLFYPVSNESAGQTWSLDSTSFAEALQTVAVSRTAQDGTWDALVPLRDPGSPVYGEGNAPQPGTDGGLPADFGTPDAKAL